jgi:hypothetical protein
MYNSAETRSGLIPGTTEWSRVFVITLDDVLNCQFLRNDVNFFTSSII